MLEQGSEPFLALHEAALARRCVFVAGLSGVGKSLLIQQLALIATELGRVVHLLQWDVARSAFETPAILARYPEVDGVTHAAIRLAVGLWARDAVRRWDREHADASHLLVGETPLVGNRLIELAQRREDEAEPLLAGDGTLFVVPAPSRAVRQAIEGAREREIVDPRHERERGNAIPRLLRAHWEEIAEVARQLGVAPSRSDDGYDPDVYAGVYLRLLRHRRAVVLPITSVLAVRGSPHDLGLVASELVPAADDVERIMPLIDARPAAEIERDAAGWYRV